MAISNSTLKVIASAIAGKVISFPTDTVPALGVKPELAHEIFALKKRPADKPLILMAASSQDLWHYTKGTAEEMNIWQEIAARYWPGALTLVLPASDSLPRALNPQDNGTIGIRVPDSSIAREILAQTGPLATTSANLSGEPPLKTAVEISAHFPEILTLDDRSVAIDQNFFSGLPSTVAQWTNRGWKILRQGQIVIINSKVDG